MFSWELNNPLNSIRLGWNIQSKPIVFLGDVDSEEVVYKKFSIHLLCLDLNWFTMSTKKEKIEKPALRRIK